jgi:lysophospholipase L1-like esterase
MKRVSLLLVLICLAVGSAAAQDPAYVALGDSIPFGYNPTVPLTTPNLLNNYHGYPQYVSEGLRNLTLTNASCPGQTSSSFLKVNGPDNGCNEWRANLPLFVAYSSLQQSQLNYAISFLVAHPNTRLLTITIGGDDLLLLSDVCTAQNPGNPAGIESCVLAGLGDVLVTYAKNLTAIYLAIRFQGHYKGPIVAVNYPSPDYTNAIETTALAELNEVTQGLTTLFGGRVADTFSAFAEKSAAYGGLPCADQVGLLFSVAPGVCDVHPTVLGQQLMGKLVLGALIRD